MANAKRTCVKAGKDPGKMLTTYASTSLPVLNDHTNIMFLYSNPFWGYPKTTYNHFETRQKSENNNEAIERELMTS